jgi:beta-N-acetylhexosaminidase
VTGNTDVTMVGTTDSVTTPDDANLAPFRAGVEAGADLVMVSSALYPKIDADHRAPFSQAVVTGVLRERLGFRGVVITDDVGAAKAVADVPVGDRATQFVAAGGDIVLTALPSTVPAMAGAVVARAASDPAFAAQVDAAVKRVLDLKVRRGLASCP